MIYLRSRTRTGTQRVMLHNSLSCTASRRRREEGGKRKKGRKEVGEEEERERKSRRAGGARGMRTEPRIWMGWAEREEGKKEGIQTVDG